MRPGEAPRCPGEPRAHRPEPGEDKRCRQMSGEVAPSGGGQIQGNQSREGAREGHGAQRGLAITQGCHTGMSHRAGHERSSSPS